MTISSERKEQLKSIGFTVEDMEAEWGVDYVNSWRWFHGDDFGLIQNTEADAWLDASNYATEEGLI